MEKKKVTILLATYNGEKYLRQQLDSIYGQTYKNISVLVRDDGSKDGTCDILKEYSEKYGLQYVKGRNIGAFANFLELIRMAPDSDYYAYSDQDDVWVKDKIQIAVSQLENKIDESTPGMFIHSNYTVNNALEVIDQPHTEGLSEANNLALGIVRNICQGSACVLNRSLMDEVKKIPEGTICQHDWWTYLVCLSLSGRVIADRRPLILYRQHGDNVLGAHVGVFYRLKRRFKMIFEKSNHSRQHLCKLLLELYGKEIPSENEKILEEVVDYRKNISKWITFLFDPKFYRYSTLEYKISFFGAILTRTV